MKCFIRELTEEKILNPMYGDFKLQVFPVSANKSIILPDGFKLWENQINRVLSLIPFQKQSTTHYVTIDSKFFTEDGFLRREGVHIDGNYCVDPNFKATCWGGGSWSGNSIHKGKVISRYASPYGLEMPIGEYVSETKGGVICASSYSGCDAWSGDISDEVKDEGAYDEIHLKDAIYHQLLENKVYFMSSNTPHATTLIPKGTRRTLIRINLHHEYNNYVFNEEKRLLAI